MKIVIAGNYKQYLNWLLENKLTPKDAVYADREENLMGLEFEVEDIVRTGEHWNSPVGELFLASRIGRTKRA